MYLSILMYNTCSHYIWRNVHCTTYANKYIIPSTYYVYKYTIYYILHGLLGRNSSKVSTRTRSLAMGGGGGGILHTIYYILYIMYDILYIPYATYNIVHAIYYELAQGLNVWQPGPARARSGGKAPST